MKSLRIAHISDPHFASITYNLNQFFSKRWLGNCNLILFRHKTYQTEHLSALPELFTSLGVEFVTMTGDFTTTSLDQEYSKAKAFVDSFPMETAVMPGNHDIYTKESERAHRFYHYFPNGADASKVEVRKIKQGFWWVGLDCAYASNLVLSNGKFTKKIEESLESALSKIPAEEQIVLGNHFPLITTGNFRHDLAGAKRLQALLKRHPNVKLYLHGHDHSHYLIDKQTEGLPLVLNSGSVSHLPGGTFYLLDLTKTSCHLKRYELESKKEWVVAEEREFTLR